MPHRFTLFLGTLVVITMASGCASTPFSLALFDTPENTAYRTAAMRVDAVREFRARATGVDSPEQRRLVGQLAAQIQVEPDPLVREAIVETLASFRTPLATEVLLAGLKDDDEVVRRKCCVGLGRHGDDRAIAALTQVIQTESNVDVRIAAVKALGQTASPTAVQGVVQALEDRDPALQFAGMQSMRTLTGRDLGGNVAQWLEYAQSNPPLAPGGDQEISVAGDLRSLSPF